jgi:hypothetical protein
MRYSTHFCVATSLFCSLCASPVRADMATPDAGVSEASEQVADAIHDLASILDGAAQVDRSAALGAGVKATGPGNSPGTSQGVDSSLGSATKIAFAAAGGEGYGQAGAAHSSGSGESSQASSPATSRGELRHALLNQPVPTTDLSSITGSLSQAVTSPTVTTAIVNTGTGDTSPVPIPSSLLLLGGGLLGLFPLRRGASASLVV